MCGFVPAIGRGLSVLVRPVRQLRGSSAAAAGAQSGAWAAGAAVALSSAADALAQRRSVIGALDEAPVLELRDVGMQYGSLVALHGVSLNAYRGEVVGIIGPNGAGKTTLLRCIADGRERSTGDVLINGHRIDRLPPQRCVALGVSRKFQTPNVFDALTVLDCLRVARSYRKPTSLWRRSRRVELPEPAFDAVEVSGLTTMLNERAGHLSHGAKQALELAMVLAQEPTVLLLDEPTAGLTRDERAAIGSVLTELAQSHRLCILLIEHDLDFVREISTRLVVLHMGKVLLDGPLSEIAHSDLIRSIYVGGTT